MVLLGAIWGSSFLLIKVGVSELHPLYVTLGRVGNGAVVLLLILLLTRDRLPRDPAMWGHNLFVAVVGVTMPFTLFGFGEQRISSGLAGIWNSTTPLVVLPVAVLVFRTERFTARRLVGLLLGFTGALVILGVWRGTGGSALTGQLMCLAAASCYGVAIPYTRRFISPRAGSAVSVSAIQLLLATVLLAVVAPLATGHVPDVPALSGNVVASVAVLGALGTGIAFVINYRNIRVAGASTASMVTYIVPLFAVVVGALALSEQVEWYQPAGALVVLAGIAVSQGRPRLPTFRRRPTRRGTSGRGVALTPS
jgi:drug/metabolite transporter (DMT)-like permease